MLLDTGVYLGLYELKKSNLKTPKTVDFSSVVKLKVWVFVFRSPILDGLTSTGLSEALLSPFVSSSELHPVHPQLKRSNLQLDPEGRQVQLPSPSYFQAERFMARSVKYALHLGLGFTRPL